MLTFSVFVYALFANGAGVCFAWSDCELDDDANVIFYCHGYYDFEKGPLTWRAFQKGGYWSTASTLAAADFFDRFTGCGWGSGSTSLYPFSALI